mgnify:CR=1 FL=1
MQSGRGRGGRGRGRGSLVSLGRGRAIAQRMNVQNPNVLALNETQKRMELNNYANFFKKYTIRVPSNHRGNWREWETILGSWLERHNSSVKSRKNRKKLGLSVKEKSPKSEKPKKPKRKSSPRS